ncbi:5199_t:CDS:2 [Entrophospora sp. SA101]|nr:5199_t:CDS:2 [Entrophospora sp. SA101]
MDTRISRAIKASNELITNLHRDGLDRGCIATFNDSLVIRQSFTTSETLLHRSLNSLEDVATDGTRLYDSMIDVATDTFRRKADASRPWIMIVVTDGEDTRSRRTANQCSKDIYSKFTNVDNNFLFVLGVGDGVNGEEMEKIASSGKFTYIPVKDFYLLEFAFLTIAMEITTSNVLSIKQLSVSNVSATWAEVQQRRELSDVAIDYTLLIDVSASMTLTLQDPLPLCFAGHELKESGIRQWFCDVCGKNGTTLVDDLYLFYFIELQKFQSSFDTNFIFSSQKSKYYCRTCSFDACPSHCKPNARCVPVKKCDRSHSMRYASSYGPWKCDECQKFYEGKRLRCQQCDYDVCPSCVAFEGMIFDLIKLGMGSQY